MSKDKEKNRSYVKKHYNNNKDYYLQKNRRATQRKKEFLQKIKEVPCKDCGKEFPYYVMEFDHVGNKNYNISCSLTWNRIHSEVARCEIVCANCHAIRTYKRRNELL